MHPIISSTPDLAAFCARAEAFPSVAVDTEFMRDRTFWPVLCLVQVATPDEALAIDALADGIDLSPLFALLSNRRVLKVFHSARQDLEIFHMLTGRVPEPVFDTQLAAMVCGYGDSIGYEKLVRDITGHSVDKALQFTDWAKRPLSEKQVAYALSDVTHLRKVHASLSKRLESRNRGPWLAEEMAILADPATYRSDPEDAWKRLKARARKPLNLAMLRALAAWREREAQARDVPRNRVLGDRMITEISAAAPRTASELRSLRAIDRGRLGKDAAARIVAVLDEVRNADPSSWPRPPDERPQQQGNGAVAGLLKLLLQIRCEEHGVAPKLLASSADLAAIAQSDTADVPALQGWRREIFGADALRLKHGEIAIVIRDSRPALLEVGSGVPGGTVIPAQAGDAPEPLAPRTGSRRAARRARRG